MWARKSYPGLRIPHEYGQTPRTHSSLSILKTKYFIRQFHKVRAPLMCKPPQAPSARPRFASVYPPCRPRLPRNTQSTFFGGGQLPFHGRDVGTFSNTQNAFEPKHLKDELFCSTVLQIPCTFDLQTSVAESLQIRHRSCHSLSRLSGVFLERWWRRTVIPGEVKHPECIRAYACKRETILFDSSANSVHF